MLKVLDGGKGRKRNADGEDEDILGKTLDEIAREGARQMIAKALDVEVAEYLERHRAARDESGRSLVVRNGRARSRSVTMGAGTVAIQSPRVNDKRIVDGSRQKFRSAVLPPYMRRSAKVTEVLPLLYLAGLSTGDFEEALKELLGEDASGLSASSITRLTGAWRGEREEWRQRSLADLDYVYIWVDGVHFNIRLEEDRLAALVVVGVRPDGTKELVAIEDGYRESTESWLTVLRALKRRGMRAPVLAVGDGALGFWAAVGEVWPETREQRCWVHKIANVLDKLPKRLQPEAKKALHGMVYAAKRADAEAEKKKFVEEHGAKYPKAVQSLAGDWDRLVAFFDLPAEHWKHLRTTNPIESTFATVRLRTRVTKGAGSREAGLSMAFKLIQAAEKNWRRLDGHELIPLVRAGTKFENGKRIEREDAMKKNDENSEKVAA
ncbi:MAG: IS256 family transposase [Planctomycetota bacterium]